MGRWDGKRLKHLGHPLYNIWNGIKQRCRNPRCAAYRYYGARGIAMCERWNDFEAFVEDMGPRPSLKHSVDRINPNGNYEPRNCRWATPKEQAANLSAGGHWNKVKNVCKRGHAFTPENTIIRKNGGRKCRLCLSIMNHEHYRANRGAMVPSSRMRDCPALRKGRSHGNQQKPLS